jgi:hypothetical protein
MLRHSFAVRWYSILSVVWNQRIEGFKDSEVKDLREQFGDLWYQLAALLGHRNPLTTRDIYRYAVRAIRRAQRRRTGQHSQGNRRTAKQGNDVRASHGHAGARQAISLVRVRGRQPAHRHTHRGMTPGDTAGCHVPRSC